MTLLAHCNTKVVDEATVRSIPAPEHTKTWRPYSHGEVLDMIGEAARAVGIETTDRKYSVSRDGARMFGVWNLAIDDGKMQYSLGIRNSIDKSMSLGLCAGTHVFVCDNLAFSADMVRFRKHTSGLDLDEIRSIATDAVGRAIEDMDRLYAWHNMLAGIYVPQQDFKVLVYDVFEERILAPSCFDRFKEAHREELALTRGTSLDGARSLYTFHGAVTRTLRGKPLGEIADRTARLGRMCERYIENRDKDPMQMAA